MIIPTGSAFSRRFSITDDWSDISIGTVWGITDTTTDATAPAGTSVISPTLPKDIASFGIRNSANPSLLPGEVGVNFVGSTSKGTTFTYSNAVSSMQFFRQGAFNGTTITTQDPVDIGNDFRKIFMHLGDAYTQYTVLFQRFIKDPLSAQIGLIHRRKSVSVADITPAAMLTYITSENISDTGLVVLPYLFDESGENALNTVFFYIPELTIRLKLYSLVIRNNVGI